MKKTFLIAFVAIFLPILNVVFAQAPNFSRGYLFSSTTYAVLSYKNADADKIAEGPTPSAVNYYGQTFSAANLSPALSAPAISYSPSTKTFTLNAAIATYSATNTGGAVGSFSGFGTPTTVSTTLNAPYGIGSDASGNIYVANSGANNILQYNSSGTYVGVLSTTGATLSNPVGVVFDSQGNYYILNESSTSTVYKYNAAGVLQSSNLISGLNFSYGIAIDASDNLYVTSYPTNGNGTSVQKYNNSTGAVLLTLGTHNLNKPTGIAVDLSGNIYVLMGGSAKVYQFPSTGGNGTLFTSTTFGTTPYAITTDKSNNVYVANSSGGSVTVYNSSGTSLASLTGLTTPRGLIVDKLGNLYVASTTGNTLTKYPPNGGFFISPTLPTGLSFNGVTGDITGTPTVASAATNYTITAYNTSGSSSTTVNITCAVAPPVITYAGSPFSVAVSSSIASGTIVATNSGSTISTSGVTYNSSGSTILTSSILNKPYAMAFDASGNLYVANSANNNIVKYNTSGASSVFITSVTNPTGIVFDASGNCYVLSNSSSSVVYKYPSTGGSSGTSFISGLNTAYGLAIDQSGNFYVSNYTGSTYSVKKYNSAGSAQSLTLSNLGTPVNVAVSPNGTIYVLNNTGNSVTYYNSSGTYQGTITTGLSGAYGLYCDASGNVYVGDSGNGSIKIYKPDGTSIGTVTLTDVRGIAVDSQGYLYGASNSGNSVTKFTPTNGYFAASLPLGLVLDSTTGEISGTPTTATAATDYTITAWNSAGSGNTKVNINCNTQHTWISTSNTDWSTAANWSPAVIPASSDQVVIGSSSNLATPTLAAGTYTVGSIVMQTSNSQAPSLALSAGATLNVTGAISVNYTSVFGATTITGGTGSVLNASSISVTNNNTSNTNTASLTLSVPTVTLTGNLALTSTLANGGKLENSTFTLSSGTLTAKNIQTTNGAGTTSTLAFTSGSTLYLTGASPFSTLSSTGTNTITGLTSGNNVTIGYTGTNNQVVYTDAAISNSSLTGGISYTNIVFGGSGIKTPAGSSTNNINVSGNFTNNLTSNTTSTYVDLSTPTLNLTGTGQTLAGGGGVGTTLYTTVLTGGSKTMSGTFTLDSQSTLSMNGTSSTTLDAGSGSLTLNSDANSSASIGALANSSGTVTGIISGTIKVQRYMTGNNDLTYRGYRLLSSSVYDASSSPTGAYFNLSFLRGYASDNTTVNSGSYFTGTGGQTNGFDASGNPTAYFYREDMVPDTRSFVAGNYRGVVKINNSPAYSIGVNTEGTFNMPVGNGVLFFYRGNNGTNISTAPSSLTFTMTGPINQGKITVKPWFNSSSSNLSYTASTGSTDPRYGIVGFNLVGNPYPCSIDWNTAYNNSSQTSGIYAPNTDQSIYIYNATSKNYGVYLNTATPGGSGTNGTSNIIPAGQGFFVRATSASAQLIFNETAKAPTSQPGTLLLNSTVAAKPNPRLRLQFSKDDINKDETLIILNNKAHTQYVQNEDALYLTGTGSVSLSNISADNKALAITQVPVTGSGQTIPLKIRATTQGAYNIDLTEGQDLPAVYDVWLKDAYTKDSLDLKHNTNYNFRINSDTSSTGSKRFSVVLRINSSKMVHLLNFSGVKNTSSINLNWTTENEGDYTTYILQHSTDNGKSFSTLDSLTSANLGTYKDLDTNPASGANLYRLKQIDILGNISYSNVITVMYSLPGSNIIVNSRISLFPNPTTNALNLTVKAADNTPVTGNFKITVTNTSGIVIKSGTSAQADWHTDVSNLTPGTYFIEVINLKDNSLTGRTSFVKM